MKHKLACALLVISVLAAIILQSTRIDAAPDIRPGRMTGAGSVPQGERVSHAFDLYCDPDHRPSSLTVGWGRNNRFRLESLTTADCTRTLASHPDARAGFDTFVGSGTGRYNGAAGATARWTFTDIGGRPEKDIFSILITDASGNIVLSACGRLRTGNHTALGAGTPPARPPEDPLNVVNSIDILPDGTPCLHLTAAIPDDSVRVEPPDPAPKPDPAEPVSPAKIHPVLEGLIRQLGPFTRVDVIVNLTEDVEDTPKFPELPAGVTRDSPLGLQLQAETELLMQALLAQRVATQTAFLGLLQTHCVDEPIPIPFGVEVDGSFSDGQGVCTVVLQEHFGLINAFLADVALGAVTQMAAMPLVLFIQPRFGEEQPPAHDPTHDNNANNDVADARALIRSDPLLNLPGAEQGTIGLLDSGVRGTHTHLTGRVGRLGDCVNGGDTCLNASAANFNPGEDCFNHGTSTAAVLSGNNIAGANNVGNDFRGVTGIPVDSWKVYATRLTSFTPTPGTTVNLCTGGLDAAAVTRAFRAGRAAMNNVMVAQVQAVESDFGVVASMANAAFNSGQVVIAANGNNNVNGTAGTVNSPARAHKAIGVGAYNVLDPGMATLGFQSLGPTDDNRYKPDLQTPTNTETADTGCGTLTVPVGSMPPAPLVAGTAYVQQCTQSNRSLRVFTGTSGATPYAAGVAALLNGFLRRASSTEPGHTYAQLIQTGRRVSNVNNYNNAQGAGALRHASLCVRRFWGKVTVASTGWTTDIPIRVDTGKTDLDAAIWWPQPGWLPDKSKPPLAGPPMFPRPIFPPSLFLNDIDLYLVDPLGGVQARGYSAVSVFEHIRVPGALVPGDWKVRIKGGKVGVAQPVYWVVDVGC